VLDKIHWTLYNLTRLLLSGLVSQEDFMDPVKITKNIYLIGNSDMTDGKDCSIYLIDLGEIVLVDAGAGASVDALTRNIERIGLDPGLFPR